MAGIYSVNVYEIAAIGEADGQSIVNVFHYATQNPEDNSNTLTMNDLLLAFRNEFWRVRVLPRLSTAYHGKGFTVKEYQSWVHGVAPDKGHWAIDQVGILPASTDGDDNGSIAGDYLPTYVAATMGKRVLKSGRKYRGSSRFSPIIESWTEGSSGNTLTATGLAALQNVADGLKSSIDADPGAGEFLMRQGLFHKTYTQRRNPANITARALWDRLEVTQVNRQVGSQLSRKRLNVTF